jgi:hypothetical protein
MQRMKEKKNLKNKMTTAFGDNIKILPVEYQSILLDDLVTAFENRVEILERAQASYQKNMIKNQ